MIPSQASIQSKLAIAIVKNKYIKDIEEEFGHDFTLPNTTEALMRN